MTVDINNLVRNNILQLKPYASARKEFSGKASIFLDANENAYGSPLPNDYSRYPDPFQREIKEKISKMKGVSPDQIFLGNGSDEIIDLAIRIFCDPGKDKMIVCPPTYGMYEVCAGINDIEVIKINLLEGFQLDVENILAAANKEVKMLFICSPNNPTGNSMHSNDIEKLVQAFPGIVLVDEAYIDFASDKSFLSRLEQFPNLIILQTLSKAWGLAGLRLGMCFASTSILEWLNTVKPPYNINAATQQWVLQAIDNQSIVEQWVYEMKRERKLLEERLLGFPFVEKIYPSNANFLLVKVDDAIKLYTYLCLHGIIVRNRQWEVLCENCLRISIGTKEENIRLINTLTAYEQ